MNVWASGQRCRSRIQNYAFLSGKRYSSTVDNHAFSQSLLLPKTAFPLRPNPTEIEARLRARTCTDLYQWQSKNLERPEFIFHDGPPYANGDLHMGHAMNKILKDFINRFHVSRGWRVQYIPGWDCHGLPIENKALHELGKDSVSLPPLEIRRAAHKTALREIDTQRDQFQRLGIMAEWSDESTYRTIDHLYQMRQLRVFRDMVENGLIYRRYRPVHFSPSSRSALAEAELVYKDDHVSYSVFVTFELQAAETSALRDLATAEPRPIQLLVWTTTSWTLTANMAIAVHPDLVYVVLRRTGAEAHGLPLMIVVKDRIEALASIIGATDIVTEISGKANSNTCSELVGASYTPIFASLCPGLPLFKIIPAPHVTAASGTGLVHCAPAHGAEDYNAFRELGLLGRKEEIICHVGSAGEFTSEVTETVGESGKALIGEGVLDGGSRKVVEILKEVGALVKIQRIKHRYPYDWRTNKPIIVTSTSQWFANLDDIKTDALAALEGVSFFPPISRSRLTSFIQLRSEWCISRQRVWGVPIPALYNIPTDKAVLDSSTLEHILAVLDKKGIEYWWEGPVEEFVPPALREEGVAVDEVWRKGTDTMDVWFDSGTAWSMLRERENGAPRADVCLEGSDQHRGWFQSQLLTAVASSPPAQRVSTPYATLITHGMVLDQAGKKMSKSLGNVTSPMTVVNGGANLKKEPVYGADVLRFWIGTVDYWNDTYLGPVVLAQAAEGVRKIRNTARFILGNVGSVETRAQMKRVHRSEMGLTERYIMHELYTLEQIALVGYSQFNFAKVVAALSNFANITLSSFYFDISKDGLYANALDSFERRAVVTVLEQVLTTMNFIMAPIVPHLAEEVHEAFNETESSVFMTQWKPLELEWNDPKANEEMKMLLRLRTAVLAGLEEARADKKIKSSLEAEVELLIPDLEEPSTFIDLLQREENFLKTFFITSDATLIDEGSLGTTSPEWVYVSTMDIPSCEEDLSIRIRPAQLEKCSRCWTFTRLPSEPLCPRCTSVVQLT
ncbi:tRNA synthetases class I-domain-containing protein [Mycena capillaripes]|nr:tRNA synthetases class I-domain-containing protein [Mycena capillaripes]